ncbi:MAG: ATP-binding cassette domain-containing protein [Chloroflexi bacterium]|nr:ATP-binding cassette domain-containing protein [Chloroflexota bacterium]
MATDTVLELVGVTRVFGEGAGQVVAVERADLRVGKGELLLIMGPSGSGKTTLLTMAGGLLPPTSGHIRLGGRDLTALSDGELSRLRQQHIGFVFQSFNLLAALTALENVEVALGLAGRDGQGAKREARRLLEDLGLGHRLHHHPRDLSGGEKQRVSVARALANNPELVLADEPTANLDSQKGREVVELLRKVAKEMGKTVIVVSHDHRIRELADRVLWLEDGKLKEMEVHRDPVCGMEIDPARAKASLAYEGKVYYFCAAGCLQLFQKDPGQFLASQSSAL